MFNHLGYIDPSTGSMFIQAIFGVGLAVMVVLRKTIGSFISKVKMAFSRKSTDEDV